MVRRKKEVEEKVIEESFSEQSVNETKKTKAAKKETVLVPENISTETNDAAMNALNITTGTISTDLGTGEDSTVKTYIRQTPFGKEVWDPIEKRTVLIDG